MKYPLNSEYAKKLQKNHAYGKFTSHMPKGDLTHTDHGIIDTTKPFVIGESLVFTTAAHQTDAELRGNITFAKDMLLSLYSRAFDTNDFGSDEILIGHYQKLLKECEDELTLRNSMRLVNYGKPPEPNSFPPYQLVMLIAYVVAFVGAVFYWFW